MYGAKDGVVKYLCGEWWDGQTRSDGACRNGRGERQKLSSADCPIGYLSTLADLRLAIVVQDGFV